MTRLVLVRHGESVAQVERILSGHDTCRGLSDRGREQVARLRDRFARTGEVQADVVLTSLLPRAIETAEILSPAIGGGAAVQDCDLCEIHVGEAEGLSWDDFQERYWQAEHTPDMPPSPGGESRSAFLERTAAALRRYAEDHRGKTIVAAVHGGIVEASIAAFLGIGPHDLPVWHVRNTAITEWLLHGNRFGGGGPERWHLVRFNDHGHLPPDLVAES